MRLLFATLLAAVATVLAATSLNAQTITSSDLDGQTPTRVVINFKDGKSCELTYNEFVAEYGHLLNEKAYCHTVSYDCDPSSTCGGGVLCQVHEHCTALYDGSIGSFDNYYDICP